MPISIVCFGFKNVSKTRQNDRSKKNFQNPKTQRRENEGPKSLELLARLWTLHKTLKSGFPAVHVRTRANNNNNTPNENVFVGIVFVAAIAHIEKSSSATLSPYYKSGFGRLEVVVSKRTKGFFPEDGASTSSSSSSREPALWWWRWWCLEDDRAVEKREREKHGVFENNENAKRAVSVGCFSGWRIGHHTSAESNEKRKNGDDDDDEKDDENEK